MPKPSPAQARLLRALAAPPGNDWRGEPSEYMRPNLRADWRSQDGSRDELPWSVYSYNVPREFRRVRPQTFMVLFNNGWLEEEGVLKFLISSAGREVLASLNEGDFISPQPEPGEASMLTADVIVEVLAAYYKSPGEGNVNSRKFIFFPELHAGTGMGQQRIDFWAMHCWNSGKFAKFAYEVKVSRTDFLHELENPQKRQFALSVSNYFYFAAPVGMIDPAELPKECGLVEIDESGYISFTVKPPWREVDDPPWKFVAALGRRLLTSMVAEGAR